MTQPINDQSRGTGMSAPVPCDHVLTLDEAIAHAEECADNTPCGSQHRQLADWLKELKALKSSVSCGNTAAVRDALELIWNERGILDFCHNNLASKTWQDWDKVYMTLRKWMDKAMTALAAPPRNCDVGTQEEQAQRFDAFCDANKYVGDDGTNWCSTTCPCNATFVCGVKWSQMPYKEGGAK